MSDQQNDASTNASLPFRDAVLSVVFILAGLVALAISNLMPVLTAFQTAGLWLVGGLAVSLGCLAAPSLLRPATMAAVRYQQLIGRVFVAIAFLILAYPGAPDVLRPSNGTAIPTGTCATPAKASEEASGGIIIANTRDMVWRPRGAMVRFSAVEAGSGRRVALRDLRVCFAWLKASPEPAIAGRPVELMMSPMVRQTGRVPGDVEYAAEVPDLPPVPLFGGHGSFMFTGLGLVPLADVVVEAVSDNDTPVVLRIEIGVSSVSLALAMTILLLVVMLALLTLLVHSRVRGMSVNSLLAIISDKSGHASAAQFQMILWTAVIGSSVIFTVLLSGELIEISSGMLVLLGVCAVMVLADKLPALTGKVVPIGNDARPGLSVMPRRVPRWTDLITIGGDLRDIDLTRIQMLVLTTLCALFISFRAISTFGQAEMPANLLFVMGVSNGIYLSNRLLPRKSSAPGYTKSC